MTPADPAACLLPPAPGRVGRPARDGRLWMRVSGSELARWKAAARETGVPVSSWLRFAADECAAAGRDPSAWRSDLNRLLRDLNSGVGNDINQLAKTINTQLKAGLQPDRQAAEEALSRMSADLEAVRAAALALLGAPKKPRRRG